MKCESYFACLFKLKDFFLFSIRKQKGVWILNILNDSLADKDGRLRINDRILEINCQDIKNGSKNDALKLISVSIPLT